MNRPGFTICICPDSEIIQIYISKQLGARSETWKKKVFWGDEELGDPFWDAFYLNDLFGQCSAVVLRRAHKLQEGDWKRFAPVLKKFRPSVWLFFCLEGQWEKGKPSIPAGLKKQKFFKLAQDKDWIWQYPGLTREYLSKYLKDWACKRDIEIPPQVEEVAVNILPLDAAHLKNELTKLELYIGDSGKIRSQDLQVLALQPDMDVFAFLRALQENRDTVEIWKQVLQGQWGADSDRVMPFLGLLLRESRMLWQLIHGEENKVWMPASAKRAKKNLASKIGSRNLASLWGLMLEAEYGIKSGERLPGQALELLVARLMNVFRN